MMMDHATPWRSNSPLGTVSLLVQGHGLPCAGSIGEITLRSPSTVVCDKRTGRPAVTGIYYTKPRRVGTSASAWHFQLPSRPPFNDLTACGQFLLQASPLAVSTYRSGPPLSASKAAL